ncbi:MAG: carbamoyl-phosphate synthase small subunit [Myxococcales bacterium]|nr:carbamoyl-phosphate synthase small subunit [Myxococcales bacterium]
MTTRRPRAWLTLEDGTTYEGVSVGAAGEAYGEVVFQTALTGYQEVLTDPSYHGQIVAMTAPQIGNVGVNPEDAESARPYCSGFIMREASPVVSNFRATGSLDAYLVEHGVVGIAELDTRALTRRLRDGGAQKGVISTTCSDRDELLLRVRRSPGLEGRDLAREVTCSERYSWEEPSWVPPDQRAGHSVRAIDLHVVAFDFGMKRNILARLRDLGARVTVVPATTSAADALALGADGYFLSNGPGDPAAVTYAAEATRGLVASGKPVFGICLGHQILGLALGGSTYKLRFGHHGANQPVMDLATGKVEITSQNHGFAVDVASLDGRATLTHVNLNDRTVEGMALADRPVFSVQYHPEASPGPHDAGYLFERFAKLMRGAA